MNRQEFLEELRKGLCGLPQEDIEERLAFYSEMIEDRIEEGFSEEEAVSKIGTVDEIVSQIVEETPLVKVAKERIKPKRRMKAWEITLLVLGSPIWLSLSIALIAVILSIYVSLWAVIVSLWAVFVSFVGCSFSGTIAGIIFACSGNELSGIAVIGAGIVCAGLSVFMFYVCKLVTKGILSLTKKFAVWTKNCIIKKGEA